MRTYSRDDVEMHSDGYRSARPAVNVKVYDTRVTDEMLREATDGDPDWEEFRDWWRDQEDNDSDILNDAFWHACDFEWEMIEQDARDILGNVRVERGGRMGGWAEVVGLPDIEDWDAVQLAKWRKFERYAKATAAGIPLQMASLVYLNVWLPERERKDRAFSSAVFIP